MSICMTPNEKGLAKCGNSVPSRPASVADFFLLLKLRFIAQSTSVKPGLKLNDEQKVERRVPSASILPSLMLAAYLAKIVNKL